MDAERFDSLARSFTAVPTRRRALVATLGGALGVLGLVHPDETAGKKKPCPPCKKRKQGKCKKKLPDGTGCSGGTCQNGSCVAAAPLLSPPPPPPPHPLVTCVQRGDTV